MYLTGQGSCWYLFSIQRFEETTLYRRYPNLLHHYACYSSELISDIMHPFQTIGRTSKPSAIPLPAEDNHNHRKC